MTGSSSNNVLSKISLHITQLGLITHHSIVFIDQNLIQIPVNAFPYQQKVNSSGFRVSLNNCPDVCSHHATGLVVNKGMNCLVKFLGNQSECKDC